jgi:hypothetical protein
MKTQNVKPAINMALTKNTLILFVATLLLHSSSGFALTCENLFAASQSRAWTLDVIDQTTLNRWSNELKRLNVDISKLKMKLADRWNLSENAPQVVFEVAYLREASEKAYSIGTDSGGSPQYHLNRLQKEFSLVFGMLPVHKALHPDVAAEEYTVPPSPSGKSIYVPMAKWKIPGEWSELAADLAGLYWENSYYVHIKTGDAYILNEKTSQFLLVRRKGI